MGDIYFPEELDNNNMQIIESEPAQDIPKKKLIVNEKAFSKIQSDADIKVEAMQRKTAQMMAIKKAESEKQKTMMFKKALWSLGGWGLVWLLKRFGVFTWLGSLISPLMPTFFPFSYFVSSPSSLIIEQPQQ